MQLLSEYEVVIVGGRPAGASLAARLGKRGLRVLIVDRASFPSLPSVPSSPILHPGTMRLLDELGVPEASYGRREARMRRLVIEFDKHFKAMLQLPMIWGRDYVYGVDRRDFDFMLWERLADFASVTRCDEFAVTDLVRDASGRVVGILGSRRGEAAQEIRAACVVGADGRFSSVARKAGAPIVQEEKVHLSTVYYADWEGAAPLAEGDEAAHLYTTGRGLDIPMFRMPGGLTSVNLHLRADRVMIGGDIQHYYESVLRSHPRAWRRLQSARQVNQVVGIKRVGNGYRQASGAGWVLVGDALHYKDPVDGQGIYDALLETKILDAALGRWHRGESSWQQAMSEYEHEVHAQTEAMYNQTVDRLKRELYQEPPVLVIRTLLRWMLTDPVYQNRFGQYLARALPHDRLLTPGLIAGMLLRGVGRDVQTLGNFVMAALRGAT